jgi:hypothetical protein
MSHLTIRKISTQFPLTSFCCSTYRYNLYPNHHYTQGKPIVIIISFIPLNFPSLTATASSNSKHTLSLAILPNTSIKTLRNSRRKCKYYFFNRQLYVSKFNCSIVQLGEGRKLAESRWWGNISSTIFHQQTFFLPQHKIALR